jgi:hypothetical protein
MPSKRMIVGHRRRKRTQKGGVRYNYGITELEDITEEK